jgi:SAM-dependent methyltransferase
LIDSIRRALARLIAPGESSSAPASSSVSTAAARPVPVEELEARVAYLEQVVQYLKHQSTNQGAVLRHVAGGRIRELSDVNQTKDSFDFQWAELPVGRYMLENAQFRQEAAGYVSEFTGLAPEWFSGKTVLDAGCGLGRYSWALSKLGARVLSIDQSDHGLQRTADACREFPGHRTLKVDLLEPLPIDETFDLVWSFGVLHHTGDTRRAFRHVARLVKPGGYLYVMLYGEPRDGIALDFAGVNEYEHWRRVTRNKSLRDKLAVVRQAMREKKFLVVGDEHVHGYFDAIAPRINDLHTFEEIEGWFVEEGFDGVTRTVDTRNLHMIGRRVGGPLR